MLYWFRSQQKGTLNMFAIQKKKKKYTNTYVVGLQEKTEMKWRTESKLVII